MYDYFLLRHQSISNCNTTFRNIVPQPTADCGQKIFKLPEKYDSTASQTNDKNEDDDDDVLWATLDNTPKHSKRMIQTECGRTRSRVRQPTKRPSDSPPIHPPIRAHNDASSSSWRWRRVGSVASHPSHQAK